MKKIKLGLLAMILSLNSVAAATDINTKPVGSPKKAPAQAGKEVKGATSAVPKLQATHKCADANAALQGYGVGDQTWKSEAAGGWSLNGSSAAETKLSVEGKTMVCTIKSHPKKFTYMLKRNDGKDIEACPNTAIIEIKGVASGAGWTTNSSGKWNAPAIENGLRPNGKRYCVYSITTSVTVRVTKASANQCAVNAQKQTFECFE